MSRIFADWRRLDPRPSAAVMIDHRPDEHLTEMQEAFVRAVVDHHCAGRSPARIEAA